LLKGWAINRPTERRRKKRRFQKKKKKGHMQRGGEMKTMEGPKRRRNLCGGEKEGGTPWPKKKKAVGGKKKKEKPNQRGHNLRVKGWHEILGRIDDQWRKPTTHNKPNQFQSEGEQGGKGFEKSLHP